MSAPPPTQPGEASTAVTDALLTVERLSAGYAGEMMLHDISFSVQPGEAVAIIGSNGAGKTTLFHAIMAMLRTRSGRVTFAGTDIARLATHRIARLGLAYVPAERHLFPEMTVADNLRLGAYPRRPDPAVQASVYEIFPRLAERSKQPAGTLSGGEQQMLACGRALMSTPRLLLLDEPTTGLAPVIASEAYAALARLRDSGLTVLVAEQQVPLALEFASRGYVIENGRFQLSGTSAELEGNPEVRRAYRGVA
jgi:branched-chain amino acid transport system ATP-binding protein